MSNCLEEKLSISTECCIWYKNAAKRILLTKLDEMRFLTVYALVLLVCVKWSTALDGETQVLREPCTVSAYEFNTTKNPMILNPYYRFRHTYNRTSEGLVVLSHGDELVLYCVNDFNYLKNISPSLRTKTISLSCAHGVLLTGERTLSDYTCTTTPVVGQVFEYSPCAGENTYSFELGFKLLFGRIARITEGCYDVKYQRTLYTTHQLDGTSLRWTGYHIDENVGEKKQKAASRFFDYLIDGFKHLVNISITYNDITIINDSFKKGKSKSDEQFTESFYKELYTFSVKVAEDNVPFEKVIEEIQTRFLSKEYKEAVQAAGKKRNNDDNLMDQMLHTAFDSETYPLNDPSGAKGRERELLIDKDQFDLIYHLMAPHGDFPDPYMKEGSYNQVNVVPMFRTIAANNWRSLGTRIRETAISTRSTFIVTTGQDGILKYPHKDKRFHELFLGQNRTIPVPKFIYKMVVEPKTHKAIVFVLYNSKLQFITQDPCTNICKNDGFIKDDSFEIERPDEGYIICCTLDNFLKNFPTAPRPSYYIDGVLHIRP